MISSALISISGSRSLFHLRLEPPDRGGHRTVEDAGSRPGDESAEHLRVELDLRPHRLARARGDGLLDRLLLRRRSSGAGTVTRTRRMSCRASFRSRRVLNTWPASSSRWLRSITWRNRAPYVVEPDLAPQAPRSPCSWPRAERWARAGRRAASGWPRRPRPCVGRPRGTPRSRSPVGAASRNARAYGSREGAHRASFEPRHAVGEQAPAVVGVISRREDLGRRRRRQVRRRPAQLGPGGGDAPLDLLVGVLADPLGLLVGALGEGRARLFAVGAALRCGSPRSRARAAPCARGSPRRGGSTAARCFSASWRRSSTASWRLRNASASGLRDEVEQDPEEQDEVGDLPDPQGQAEERLACSCLFGTRSTAGRPRAGARGGSRGELSAEDLFGEIAGEARACSGSSLATRAACASISRPPRSTVASAAACASASFFSRSAAPSAAQSLPHLQRLAPGGGELLLAGGHGLRELRRGSRRRPSRRSLSRRSRARESPRGGRRGTASGSSSRSRRQEDT